MSFDEALTAYRQLLGDDHVIEDARQLASYGKATFETTQRVPAVLRPGTVEEVQEVLRIANRFRTPVYPISTGLNTGYGSAVPTADGSIILELKRLNQILEYDHELGFVRVQPGVTQQTLYDFLCAEGSQFWMDCSGGSPLHSVIGNIAERGFGHTPYGDHFANVAGFKVVLPQGEIIRSGFGQYENAKASDVYRWGVGPQFDGLFTQSNLGVIVEATVWLMPKPEQMQFFACRVERDEDLPELIEALKPLRLDRTVSSAMHIGNDYKVISAIQSYPYNDAKGVTPLPQDLLRKKAREWDCGAWNATGAIYGTRAEVTVARRKIRRTLRGKVNNLLFLDERKLRLATRFAVPLKWVMRRDLPEMLRVLQPVFDMTRGKPSAGILPATYWRKQEIPAVRSNLSPEQDDCGLLWIAPVAPTSGEHASAVWSILRDTMLEHGYEPAVTITLLTERTLDCVAILSFDRTISGEDQRAMACHDDILSQLCAAGYYPYRLGIQSMQKMPPKQPAYQAFLKNLKHQLDPNCILAPGRYID
ncbi:MAG: FAD-binding oxidoreductase [Congregibacter sp.]